MESMVGKIFGCLLAPFLLATIPVAEAQQPRKVPRIGYLSTVDAARDSGRTEAIRLALRELGYIEGQNIAFEFRYAAGKLDRYPELAAELVRLKVDIVVVAGGTVMVRAAKIATIDSRINNGYPFKNALCYEACDPMEPLNN